MKKHGVIVVIPAHKAAKTIASVIASLPTTITVGGRAYAVQPVVVVDDDGDTGTAAAANKAGATVLRHVMNLGPGAATRTGLRYALECGQDADYVITIDADCQHRGSDVEKLVRYAAEHKADFVVGNRLHAGNKKTMPWSRWLGNYIITGFSRTLFLIHVKDTQSGLRLIATSALPKVANYTLDWYGFCTEMLWLARRHHIQVHEVPIAVHYSKDTLHGGQNHWGVVPLFKDLMWVRITR